MWIPGRKRNLEKGGREVSNEVVVGGRCTPPVLRCTRDSLLPLSPPSLPPTWLCFFFSSCFSYCRSASRGIGNFRATKWHNAVSCPRRKAEGGRGGRPREGRLQVGLINLGETAQGRIAWFWPYCLSVCHRPPGKKLDFHCTVKTTEIRFEREKRSAGRVLLGGSVDKRGRKYWTQRNNELISRLGL